MPSYPKKFSYQNKATAESYFDKRFSSPEGRRKNEATRAALVRALEWIPATGKILDIPCGTGRFTQFFYERGYLYFGADISMEMLDVLVGEQKAPGKMVPVVRCDGEQLPFKDNVFDCVVCIRFLNLIPGTVRENILREMRRVSREWLIVQSHHLKSIGPFILLKVFIRKLIGGDVSKYQLHGEILSTGWREMTKVRIRHTRHCVGIYQKTKDIRTVQ
ncbi:MAG: class I SAM-dependent methyltransferase [Candidatus Binatia bacterium]